MRQGRKDEEGKVYVVDEEGKAVLKESLEEDPNDTGRGLE